MTKYVDQEEFYDEILESQKIGHFTERAVEILKEMSLRILLRYNLSLINTTREELIADMIVRSQTQLSHFNPNLTGKKISAFQYFGQTLRCSLAYKWKKSNKK
jgi:hypothetical protein